MCWISYYVPSSVLSLWSCVFKPKGSFLIHSLQKNSNFTRFFVDHLDRVHWVLYCILSRMYSVIYCHVWAKIGDTCLLNSLCPWCFLMGSPRTSWVLSLFFAHLPSELFELRFFVLSVALYHVKRRTAVASVKLYMDDSVGWSKARPLSIPAVKRLLPTPAADPCPARSDLAAGSIICWRGVPIRQQGGAPPVSKAVSKVVVGSMGD